ncbi:hypothetical protein AX14_001372 [Amanita brunnescens Koide BX004]|nr:hypothetical protein AX14_001372 [Amanita brunnescens Koide BX004]
MNNGYGVSLFAVAGVLTSIFGIIILREHLGIQSPSPRSTPVDEKDGTRKKLHKMEQNIQSSQQESSQQGIPFAEEIPALTKAEGMSFTSKKKREVTFVGDLLGPNERATGNIQRDYWRLRSVQSVDAHFRVRFAALDRGEGGRIRVDDEGGDGMAADNGVVEYRKAERTWLTEQLEKRLGGFGKAAAERKEPAFLNRPLGICTYGSACPWETQEDSMVVRQITQTLETTTEGLKDELKKVSGTHEAANKRILAQLESVQLEVERQSLLILALQKSLDHASEEAQTNDQVIVELERELARSRRQMAMYEHKLEMMDAMYSEFDQRAAYDTNVALQDAGVAMLGWEKEELVEKMRELERSYQELYARDAHIWELRQGVSRTIANQAVQNTRNELEKPGGMAKTERPWESSGSGVGMLDKPSDLELNKLRTERAQLQREVTTLKRDHLEMLEQGGMSRSETEQWKRRFEAAQEGLASKERELSESREKAQRVTEEVQALRLSYGSAIEDLRAKNRTVAGLQDSVVRLESVVTDLKMTCGNLRTEREELSRSNQDRMEEMQHLKNQLTEQRAMHANTDVRMEDLKKHDDELSGQLTMERDQARMREADLQRALKEATSRLTEMKALQEELKKLRASHDDLRGRLEVTTTDLESAQQALKQKDTKSIELLKHREGGQEEELQRLRKTLSELQATHEAAVSTLGTDMEAMSSKLKKELEDLTNRNSELDKWLSIQKEQMGARDQDWSNLQRIHKEETDRLSLENQGILRQLVDETKGLRNELDEMQESRDRIRGTLEFTKERFEAAQRALEQKDEEIASLRVSLANARVELQTEVEIFDEGERDANSYNDDGVDSFDDERKRPNSAYSTSSRRVKKQGKPLSEVLEDSGLFGKALSFGYRSSLKKQKIPPSAQEAVMKLGSGSRTSSRASMRSV